MLGRSLTRKARPLCIAICCLMTWGMRTQAQNATVAAESLAVRADMKSSSALVQLLKKGDAVVVDFQIRSTGENWCSIRLQGQKTRLGYARCADLRLGSLDGPPSSNENLPAVDRYSGNRGPRQQLTLTPPPAQASPEYDRVAALVVHEGAIDVLKLDALDSAARSGSAADLTRASLAHYAAGNFELSRNNDDEAIAQYRSALQFATHRTDLQMIDLLRLAYVQYQRSEFSAALESLLQARRIDPGSVAVARYLGMTYYSLNRLDEAIEQWKRAQRIRPTPDIAQALQKAERDKNAESEFRERESSHFVLRYEGGATPELAAQILRALEDDFRRLQSDLRFTPPEPIGVVLYTQQTFRDITHAPSWAGGLNDGRIRLPVEGVVSISDELSQVLMHELTHSFIRQKTGGRCPNWLDEGLADWMAGRRSTAYASFLLAAHQHGGYVSLRYLEGPWSRFSAPAADFAYTWSLASVESIIANSGMWGIQRLFEHFTTDSSVETALRSTLQIDYAGLERQTIDYLRSVNQQ